MQKIFQNPLNFNGVEWVDSIAFVGVIVFNILVSEWVSSIIFKITTTKNPLIDPLNFLDNRSRWKTKSSLLLLKMCINYTVRITKQKIYRGIFCITSIKSPPFQCIQIITPFINSMIFINQEKKGLNYKTLILDLV